MELNPHGSEAAAAAAEDAGELEDSAAVELAGPLTPAQLEARLAEERRAEVDESAGDRREPDEDEDALEELELEDAAPPAPADPTPEEVAAATKIVELEKAQESFERKVRKILGEDVELVECEACNGMGLAPPGAGAEVELLEHVHYCVCGDCAGFGQVRTGSRVQGREVEVCPACGGRGYLSLLPGELVTGEDGEARASERVYGLEPWMGNPALGTTAQ